MTAANDTMRNDDPDTLRAGINETRERISRDLDQIGDRLNPQHVKEEIKDGIREATIGRFEQMVQETGQQLNQAGSGIAQAIRDNPLPAAVAGFGLAWLYMSSQSGASTSGNRSNSSTNGNDYRHDPVNNSADQWNDRSPVDKAKEKVSDFAGQAQETINTAAQPRIETVRSTFQENPIALAAGAVVLGAIAALLVPPTQQERRVMGSVGEAVMDKVSAVTSDVSEKAQHIADRALEETKSAAKDEGLTTSAT
jgi:hypothetical protein